MYDQIKDAIAREECLLEWDFEHDGPTPTAPLLKDKFASERRKAKVGSWVLISAQHILIAD